MPVTAFQFSPDAPSEAAGGAVPVLPRAQPAAAGATGAPANFDHFLTNPKAAAPVAPPAVPVTLAEDDAGPAAAEAKLPALPPTATPATAGSTLLTAVATSAVPAEPAGPSPSAQGEASLRRLRDRAAPASSPATTSTASGPAPAATTAVAPDLTAAQLAVATSTLPTAPPPPPPEEAAADDTAEPATTGVTPPTANAATLLALREDALAEAGASGSPEATPLPTRSVPGSQPAAPVRGASRTALPARTAAAPAPASGPPVAATAADDDPVAEIRIQPLPAPANADGAKIAAASPPGAPLDARTIVSSEKKSLVAVRQSDKESSLSVGISAAQAGPAMPAATLDLIASSRVTPLPAAVAPAALPATPAAEPAAASASARVAVEAVLKLTDAQSGRSQDPVSAVSLNFKFGGDDLAIRVEWRNGEVHTQFRTDSAELRDAISSQWQASAPQTASRTTSFAPPVFSSSQGQGAGGTATGDGRNTSSQYGQPAFSGQAGGSRTPRSTPERAKPAAAPAAAAPAPSLGTALATTLRLHTFA